MTHQFALCCFATRVHSSGPTSFPFRAVPSVPTLPARPVLFLSLTRIQENGRYPAEWRQEQETQGVVTGSSRKNSLTWKVSQSRVSGWMKLPTRILHDERFALNADGTKPCVDQCVSSSIYATPFLRYGIPRKQSSTVMMPYRRYELLRRDTDGYRRECTCMGDCFVLNDTIYRFRTAAPMILT